MRKPRTPKLPQQPVRVVPAEVMASAQSSWPRAQRLLYAWLERTPASADTLRLIAMGTPEEQVMELSMEESMDAGRERVAERMYLQANELAAEAERTVKFRAVWFSGGQPKLVHYFSVGVAATDVNVYDGSLASMLRQNQVHLENTQQLFGTLFASTAAAQAKVIEGMQQIITQSMQREMELQALLAQARSGQSTAGEDDEDDDEGDGADQVTRMLMDVAAQLLPALTQQQGPGRQGENH